MRLHRFFFSADLSHLHIAVDDRDLVHQWGAVLRLGKGDKVILVHDGKEAVATIDAMTKTSATLTIGEVRTVDAEPQRRVTLCAAIVKRENMEWIVQKATEAGVKEIRPILTSRTVKTGLKMDRVRAIAKEAAEQSGRGVVPMIHEPEEFAKAMKRLAKDGRHLFCHCGVTASSSPSADKTYVWIGPEGGWSDDEVTMAKDNGCAIISLGKTTLRAETAATVAGYLAVNGMA